MNIMIYLFLCRSLTYCLILILVKMEKNVKMVLDYINEMKEFRFKLIEKISKDGIHSYADAYSYGYDKGSLSDLDFIQSLLISF